jgi:hypothetical protein
VSHRRDPPVELNFKRLSIEALSRLPVGEIIPFDPILFPTSVHAILPQINKALGLDLVTSELEDTVLAEVPVNGLTLTLTASSLAWLPGEYFFSYAPNASQQTARGMGGSIPTDELRRLRVLEVPVS